MIETKRIWTYWHQGFGKAPGIIHYCIESWRRHHPGWELILLDKDNIGSFIEMPLFEPAKFDCLGLAHRSDLIRTKLLIEYGGVWADPTCFCNRPLESWLPQYLDSGLFFFHKPGRDRIIANWFIAARRNNYFLKRLLSALIRYWTTNHFINFDKKNSQFEYWVKRLVNRSLDSTQLWFTALFTKVLRLFPYMVYHYMFYRLIKTDKDCRDIYNGMPKFSADAPHSLQRLGLLNPLNEKAKELIDSGEVPLFKLTWRLNFHEMSHNSILNYLIQAK